MTETLEMTAFVLSWVVALFVTKPVVDFLFDKFSLREHVFGPLAALLDELLAALQRWLNGPVVPLKPAPVVERPERPAFVAARPVQRDRGPQTRADWASVQDAFDRETRAIREARGQQARQSPGVEREAKAPPKAAREEPKRRAEPPPPKPGSFEEACAVFRLDPASEFTRENLQRRWRMLMHRHHPDRGGDHAQAARINAARQRIETCKGWA